MMLARSTYRGEEAGRAVIVVACLCVLLALSPQFGYAALPQESANSWRLLTRTEGRAIAKVTKHTAMPEGDPKDCSHLVHEIYARAGYDYPYASSFDIYAGNPNFGRVKNPQAGDIIVWPGHVGIVLDPGRHSFYSQVSSGPEAQDYTGAYWRSRGRARFYRLIVEDSGEKPSAKTEMAARASRKKEPVAKSQPERETVSDANDAKLPVKDAAERTPVPPARHATASAEEARPASVRANIVIAAAQRHPTRDDVADAISEWAKGATGVLPADEPLRVQMPVVIFERLAVERVRIKGDHGTADLRVDSNVMITSEGADFKQRHEKLRWELQRTEAGWSALAPAERAYLPRDVAVRIFAAQLARLSESDGATAHDKNVLGQEARLANLLSGLLQNR